MAAAVSRAGGGAGRSWLAGLLRLGPLSFQGTPSLTPPQGFYVWDELEGNKPDVISFTQLAPKGLRI